MALMNAWTGRTACLLQAALRLTNESFARHLGIAVRTVATWHQRPELTPRAEMQQLLDTALEKAPESARARFAKLADVNSGTPLATASEPGAGYPMRVAVAIVADASRVLVVHTSTRPSWKPWRYDVSQKTSDSAQPPIAAAVIAHGGKVLLVKRRVAEGSLSWQFPAGAVEEGESATEVAVRETREETGLTVTASKILGERLHPATGRTMIYIACGVIKGDARVGDTDELEEFVWSSREQLTRYVLYGLFLPVQEHLDAVLS